MHKINSKFTFDGFIASPSNAFTYERALALAKAAAPCYSPLYIYGGQGRGKTHLMYAIGNYILSAKQSSVLCISGESMLHHYRMCLKSHETDRFREAFLAIDCLLVDDFSFIARYPLMQEEFLRIFNKLFDAHKKIVINDDLPPGKIVGLQERLLSRMQLGLVTEVTPPDIDTRIAILGKILSRHGGAGLPNEAVLYMAESIHSNIRHLEYVAIRTITTQIREGRVLGTQEVRRLVDDFVGGVT